MALFFYSFSFSQDMSEGFKYLEIGKFDKAEPFFEVILKRYPKNKTARLCYGRAVGLNGNSEKAINIFTKLLEEYPSDFEIKLNYAEALLWNKNYNKAKAYYSKLVEENKTSFAALLGFANTFSNLKEYDKALLNVNKALEVLPNNPNAMISKKYINLGAANQALKAKKYNEALRFLDANLNLFEADVETLLNKANLYLITEEFDEAQIIYKQIALNPKYNIEGENGLALVAHLKGKDKLALKISENVYKKVLKTDSENRIIRTTERYIQALIWTRKYRAAKSKLDQLEAKYKTSNWVLALKATLNGYKSNFKKSIANYNEILENDAHSFDGNLGKANMQKASGLYKQAYGSALNTLLIFPKQKDATKFVADLNTNFTPFFQAKGIYSFDNGDNEAFSAIFNIEFPLSTKFKLLANYNFRDTKNAVTNAAATANNVQFGFAYQFAPKVIFKSALGLSSAKAKLDYQQLLVDLALNIKPFKLQVLDVGYKRDLQNFNADLLGREIVQNNLYANYSVSSNFNLGWFTQYFYTWQSDTNKRQLLFTSLYYNIMPKPALKAGLNYQYISFEQQLPTIYFSPKRFQAGEVFINLIKNEVAAKPKTFFYELNAATGLQIIEENESQSTYRIQFKLGYKFSPRCVFNVFGTHSNIASASAAGFVYTEFGLRFKWLLFKKPVFKTQF